MSPWQVIARREFRAVTGGWPYRVVTVVGALLLAALAWTPVLIAPLTGPSVGDGSPARILVAAPWELFQALEGQAAPRASGAALQLEWIGAELDRAGQTTADARVQDAEIDGWLELVPGPEGLQASLTLATTQRALEPLLRQLVAPVVWTGRARALGVAPEVVAALQQPVPLEVRLLPRVGADPVPRAVREAVSTLLLVGLVMAITLYGNAISMGIIQEKESRVAELLVGAVPPTQILVGKVVGIGGRGSSRSSSGCWWASSSRAPGWWPPSAAGSAWRSWPSPRGSCRRPSWPPSPSSSSWGTPSTLWSTRPSPAPSPGRRRSTRP